MPISLPQQIHGVACPREIAGKTLMGPLAVFFTLLLESFKRGVLPYKYPRDIFGVYGVDY